MPDDADGRTTAQGLFNQADAYLHSALALSKAELDVAFAESPIRFLLYHAAELYLKAYLRCAGLTVAQVEKKGHKFTKLIGSARCRGLNLDGAAMGALIYGQTTDDVMQTRYVKTGFRRRSETAALRKCVGCVRKAVRTSEARKRHIVLRGERLGITDDVIEC
jgi:hypothetical protein